MSGWLDGFDVLATGASRGPAHNGGRALAAFGAKVLYARSKSESLTGLGRSIRFPAWVGEQAGRRAGGLPPAPRHPLAATYLGLRAAAALLDGGRRVPVMLASELAAGFGTTPHSELLCGADGWLVARWRSPEERALLAGLGDWRGIEIEAIGASARELRLLVAPVRRPTGAVAPLAIVPGSSKGGSDNPIRVVDWSTLWAGPWAAGRLAAQGAEVDRIEHPVRRDGYPLGSTVYRRFNHGKRLRLLDLATSEGHDLATRLFESADVVVSGHSPRVMRNFGFDDAWLANRGPRLLVELVAYEPPHEAYPGLGEQAAAIAGLLWREGRPYPALPWADPLLGAQTLLAILAWKMAGRPSGARARLTLEGAARLAAARQTAV